MKYSTYIILCENNKYYVGHSIDPDRRYYRHLNKTGAKFTSQNKPLKIVWSQDFDNELDSIKRERQIKGWSRIKKEKLINGEWQ